MTHSLRFQPGFRLSRRDVLVLLLGGATATGWWREAPWFSALILFTVGHFFLFCNVLRMARRYEQLWTAVFLGLAVTTLRSDTPDWGQTYGLSLLTTVILAALQLRHPSYHGVWWQRVNPDLPQWWAQKTGLQHPV